MRYLVIIILGFFALTSCAKEDNRDFEVPVDSTLFAVAKPIAEVTDTRLKEVSGMVVSRKNHGYLWVHNDSGDDAKLYFINLAAEIVMTVSLEGINAIDWEDMTWRDHKGTSQLIIGDIGDNKAGRDYISLHIIEEPIFKGVEELTIAATDITTVNLQYQEGARDAESLAYDHLNDQVVLITKREERVLVYAFKLGDKKEMMLKSSGIIDWRNFTGADISTDGHILLKNYNAVFYWPVSSTVSSDNIIKVYPTRLPYVIEPQGEAIAWDSLGGYYTLSEHNRNTKQILYYYAPRD